MTARAAEWSSGYWAGTTLDHAAAVIDFDRRLRTLVMDGAERIEVAERIQIGYVLGRTSAFAHEGQPASPRHSTAEGHRRTRSRSVVVAHVAPVSAKAEFNPGEFFGDLPEPLRSRHITG